MRAAALEILGILNGLDVSALGDSTAAYVHTLAEAAREVTGKIDLLRAFSRDVDLKLLHSLESEPLEGEPHDRLFDAMLRRIELLTPHKAALKSIAAAPADGPSEFLSLVASAMDTQAWLLAAAGLEMPVKHPAQH